MNLMRWPQPKCMPLVGLSTITQCSAARFRLYSLLHKVPNAATLLSQMPSSAAFQSLYFTGLDTLQRLMASSLSPTIAMPPLPHFAFASLTSPWPHALLIRPCRCHDAKLARRMIGLLPFYSMTLISSRT
jgi:hypothetical protein